MKKEYIYDPKRYFMQITLIGWFCVAVFLLSLFMIGFSSNRPLFFLAALAAAYTVWNTFLSGSNPNKVILEEDGISFESYGKRIKYPFSGITVFLVKDFRGSGKIFLRINRHNLLRGRFWIHTREFNDSEELFLYLLKLEYQTHPDGLKARAWDSTRPDVDKRPVLPWHLPPAEKQQDHGQGKVRKSDDGGAESEI
ncbi:MAG: hypothetical protein LBD31_00385 [Treponema sp.]|jgi:hypothetical protein|nr:hypothetical protein [Treponema sp.]